MQRMTPVVFVLLALFAASCSSEADGTSPATPIEDAELEQATTGEALASSTSTAATSEAETPATEERVVVLGEDFLLSDVLALGVRPVAASSTLDEFSGIDGDTTGIAALTAADLNLEALAAQRPTQIIATRFVADRVGEELLAGIAPTVILDDGDWRQQFTDLSVAVGSESQGAAMLADYDAAIDAARAELSGQEVSLATVYPGPSLAVWVDGPSNIPQTLLDLGVVLTPGPDDVDAASNGRAFLAEERIEDLTAPTIVLAQSDAVDGEPEALEAIRSGGLWQSLPAEAADRVIVIDRLGYAGLSGRTRLVDDLAAALTS